VIIAEQLLYVVVGPAQIPLNVPKTFEASFAFGRAEIEKYRVLATVVGLTIFLSGVLIFNRAKIGLSNLRAGREPRDGRCARRCVDRLLRRRVSVGSALDRLGAQ
jgi:branched-chain amino acid transport system permease protein